MLGQPPLHLCATACGMDTAMQPCATARCRPWRGSVSPHSTNLLVVLAFVRARRKRGPEAEVGACRCTCVLEPCRVFWSWNAAWQWLWPVCMYVCMYDTAMLGTAGTTLEPMPGSTQRSYHGVGTTRCCTDKTKQVEQGRHKA